MPFEKIFVEGSGMYSSLLNRIQNNMEKTIEDLEAENRDLKKRIEELEEQNG